MKLFELFATLSLDARQFSRDVNNAGTQIKGFAKGVQNRVSAASVAIGSLAARGISKVVSAGVDMVRESLNVVKEFEQNLGGSEAVFGQWAGEVQQLASNAFKTMGLSATDYLSTANKMGSLFQGSGFNTVESMELSAKAMQRAADVASVMGIDTKTAMEAIAGAAKGNFTMMDNLGVAINDTALANFALEKGITKSVRKMSTQEKIGLAMELFMERTAKYAGNYAKENETLAGSYEILGAAWENMLIGQEGSVDDFVDALEKAAKSTMKNLGEIVPRLGRSMWQGIQKAAPKVKAAFVDLWDNKLPTLAKDAANGLISTINDVFGVNIPKIEDIKFPTWAEIEKGFATWWSTTKTNIQNATKWVLNLFDMPTETVETISATIGEWWKGLVDVVVAACSWVLGFPTPPSVQGTIDKIKKWWSDITKNLNLTVLFGVEAQGNGAGIHASSSGSEHGGGVGPGFATGLRYVPYNEFPARLHEGEAVLTKLEATAWRRGESGGAQLDYDRLGRSVASAMIPAMAGMSVQMDKQTVGRMVAPTVNREIAKDAQKRRYR